jgi:hypothetical protein
MTPISGADLQIRQKKVIYFFKSNVRCIRMVGFEALNDWNRSGPQSLDTSSFALREQLHGEHDRDRNLKFAR